MRKLYVTDGKQLQLNLPLLEIEFRTSGNPLIPIEAFIACTHYGVPLPQFVVKYIATAFNNFLEGDGSPGSLEKQLGFARSAGNRGYFADAVLDNRNHRYCHSVAILVYIFGFSVKQAAEIIAGYIKQTVRFEDTCYLEAGNLEKIFPTWLKENHPDPTLFADLFSPEDFKEMVEAIKRVMGVDITDPASKNVRGRCSQKQKKVP